jgi:hypothetical protein
LKNFIREIKLNRQPNFLSRNFLMQTREAIQQQSRHDPKNKMVYIMDFVQDFRREPSAAAIAKILPTTPEESALLAAVVETLCIETRDTATSIPLPEWVRRSEPLKTPYFVSGIENLKAIALVESPVPFRRRNVFVLSNFLVRV